MEDKDFKTSLVSVSVIVALETSQHPVSAWRRRMEKKNLMEVMVKMMVIMTKVMMVIKMIGIMEV